MEIPQTEELGDLDLEKAKQKKGELDLQWELENDRPELLLVVFNSLDMVRTQTVHLICSTVMEIPQTEELGDLYLEKAKRKIGELDLQWDLENEPSVGAGK